MSDTAQPPYEPANGLSRLFSIRTIPIALAVLHLLLPAVIGPQTVLDLVMIEGVLLLILGWVLWNSYRIVTAVVALFVVGGSLTALTLLEPRWLATSWSKAALIGLTVSLLVYGLHRYLIAWTAIEGYDE